MVACIVGVILIYRYCFTSLPRLHASAFFEQFCVQGAFGIIPIHLVEVSSPAFSALVVGTSYNLGVLIASSASYVRRGEDRTTPFHRAKGDLVGTKRYDYSRVMAIFLACSFIFTILLTILGPENEGDDVGSDGEGGDVEEGVVVNIVGRDHSRY